LSTLKAAEQAGADTIVLCDTNGGTLTEEIRDRTLTAIAAVKTPIGIHTHNDSDMGVANAVIALRHGAVHVQGTFNGYGERCRQCQSLFHHSQHRVEAWDASHRFGEVAEFNRGFALRQRNRQHASSSGLPVCRQERVCSQGGIHVSAVMKEPRAYEHLAPETVGNERRVLISELSGKSNVLYKAERMGLQVDKASAGTQGRSSTS
jgi:2-isopropylmalate synthase